MAAPSVPVSNRGRGLDQSLRTQLAPGVDTERMLLDPFPLQGPHPAGTVTIKVSQNQALCAKNVSLRLYRDGICVQTGLLSMSGDNSAGTDRTYTLGIPPESRALPHRYHVTWASPCGTGDLDSAYRMVTINPFPAPSGRRLGSTAWADAFEGPRLGPWWSPVTSAQANILTFQPPLGLRIAGVTSGKHVYGIRQPSPSGSFTAYGLVRENGGGNDVRSGIFMATEGGRAMVCGPFLQDGNVVGVIGVSTASSTSDWSAYDGYLGTGIAINPTPLWTRIRWVASSGTMFMDYSPDAITWTNLTSRSSMTQPTHMGVCIYSNSGAIQLAESINACYFGASVP